MKKKLVTLFLILTITCISGCNENILSSTDNVLSTTEQSRLVGKQVDLGVNLDYSDEILNDLNNRYNFDGNKYTLFQIIFPENVEYYYETSQYFNYPLFDQVTILSDGISGDSIFEYISTELNTMFTLVEMDNTGDIYKYYMDENGNTLRIEEIANNQVDLIITRKFDIVSPMNGEDELYFTYSGNVANSIEELRNSLIEGCQSSVVSEIVDGKFTYTFMGYSFMYDVAESVLIEDNYHFTIILVE